MLTTPHEQRNPIILHLTHAELDVLTIAVMSYYIDVTRSLETEKELDENSIYMDYLEDTQEHLLKLHGILSTYLL